MHIDTTRWTRAFGVATLFCLWALVAGCSGSRAYGDLDLYTGETKAREGVTAEEIDATFDKTFDEETPAEDVYRIQSGDTLEIVFFTHPEQNRIVKVRPDGRISLPFVGDVGARGQTPEALSDSLETSFQSVLISPQIDVLVNELGGRFYIMGEVAEGGEFEYDRPVTLLQALAMAGGYTDEARLNNFVLLRQKADGTRFAALFDFRDYMASTEKTADLMMQPYDILWVPKDNLSRWDNFARKTFRNLNELAMLVLRGYAIGRISEINELRLF